MDEYASEVKRLRGDIFREIFPALGFKEGSPLRRFFTPLLWPPADRFARLAAGFERNVRWAGFSESARSLLPRFTERWEARGEGFLPAHEPLLIASNHPGTFDALLVAASLPRDDLKIIVSGVPFLRRLEALRAHFIYATAEVQSRMNALRSAIRHLQNGGALLLFATGLVDPDPAFLPGAREGLEKWSGSLEIFLRQVPGLNVTISIVSGVLAPACMRHPLVRWVNMEAWQRQRVAEYLQIMQQLMFGYKYGLAPRVTFSRPVPAGALASRARALELARAILADHLAWIQPTPAFPSRS